MADKDEANFRGAVQNKRYWRSIDNTLSIRAQDIFVEPGW